MASAFNTQGAVPQQTPQNSGMGLSGTTAVSKALNAASSGIGSIANGIGSALGSLNSFGAPKPPTIPSPPPAPVAQPIKKQTVTTANGDTHTTEYHAPTAPAPAQTPSVPTVQGGILNAPGVGGTNGTPSNTSTGVLTTPNGATVDTQGNIITPATQPTNTYSGLIGSAANSAQSNAGIGQNAADIAAQYGKNISNIETQGNNAQAGYLSTGTSPVAEGGAAIIANTQANQVAGQAQAESAALQGTGQQLTAQNQETTGLLGAASGAAPIQVPYNNQIINPQTGQPTNGTGTTGTLPAAAQTFVNSLAQQVQNGQMTRDEATTQLSAYGTAGLQALNTALGSNFNTNASNASAGTTAVGQQIQTAADSTNKALDTLSSSFASLPGWETGTIPAGNSIAQWVGSQLGDAALTQYKTNLADARSQLIGVLNSSGGTPTGNEATANEYLPDNMTPAQFQQNVGTTANPGIVRQLVSQKVTSFTGSGAQTPGFTEGQTSSDGSLVYKNGQWVVKS